ncbi:hypothetical protein J6590_055715 [Homalodisca vitripennis]|nr:hypothetical protein J6590_055715 [Homalodisca vitripennis]
MSGPAYYVEELWGCFFINGTLDGVSYLDMLRNRIIPALRNIVGENLAQIWFQQDGVPAHYRNIASLTLRPLPMEERSLSSSSKTSE